MSEMEGAVSSEPYDPRPILWTVICSYDRRADMLSEYKPCRDLEQVISIIRDATERRATEIKVRDYVFKGYGREDWP